MGRTNVLATGTGCHVTVGAAPFSGQGPGVPGVLPRLGESQTPSSVHIRCGFQTPHLTLMEAKAAAGNGLTRSPAPRVSTRTRKPKRLLQSKDVGSAGPQSKLFLGSELSRGYAIALETPGLCHRPA